MDDRYDDYGNAIVMKCDDQFDDAEDEATKRKRARSEAARKGMLTKALICTRTQLSVLVDRVCQRFFVQDGVKVHFRVISEQPWDNTILCWLVEGKLFLQENDYVIPRDLPITEYNPGECVLTVRVSRDPGRDLYTFHGFDEFRRQIDGVKLVMAYLYDHFKDYDYREVDPYTALKEVRHWLVTPMVESHLRTITERFVTAPVGGAPQPPMLGNGTGDAKICEEKT